MLRRSARNNGLFIKFIRRFYEVYCAAGKSALKCVVATLSSWRLDLDVRGLFLKSRGREAWIDSLLAEPPGISSLGVTATALWGATCFSPSLIQSVFINAHTEDTMEEEEEGGHRSLSSPLLRSINKTEKTKTSGVRFPSRLAGERFLGASVASADSLPGQHKHRRSINQTLVGSHGAPPPNPDWKTQNLWLCGRNIMETRNISLFSTCSCGFFPTMEEIYKVNVYPVRPVIWGVPWPPGRLSLTPLI